MGKNDPELLQSYIIRFIDSQKERILNNEITESTLGNYIKAIKLFCSINDLNINWTRIRRGIPAERHSADDRIPTWDEIKMLLQHPDRRIKVIVSIMISSGIRVGSFDYLKWKHVVPIINYGVVVAAKLIVTNTKINNRIYFSFITSEAYNILKDYMNFRQLHGEKITGRHYASWEERLERSQKCKIRDKLERLRRRRLGKDPITPDESGLRRRIKELKNFYEGASYYWGHDGGPDVSIQDSWNLNVVQEFLYLTPRPTLTELIQVFRLPKSVISVDSLKKFRLRGYVPDPEKPGWLKYNKEAYIELLKSEAQKRIELMQQIIKSHQGKEI
jgi:integrase